MIHRIIVNQTREIIIFNKSSSPYILIIDTFNPKIICVNIGQNFSQGQKAKKVIQLTPISRVYHSAELTWYFDVQSIVNHHKQMSKYPLGSGNSNTSLNKATTNQSPPLAGRSTISIIFQMPNAGLCIEKSPCTSAPQS